MKKTILFLVLIILLAAVVPAQAAKEVVGVQINLLLSEPQITFFAGEPFHIQHGIWYWQPSLNEPAEAVGLYKFDLKIDGKTVKADYVDHQAWGNPEEWPGDKVDIFISWIYNFPEGMQGTHKFEGIWSVPCASLYGKAACPDLLAPIVIGDSVVEITFE
jgi:hypothetical protein